jgi:redox-sensitive bicupin YhaK (pirin superfamily)
MKKVIHPANERGNANHGWLQANHSFSFASYYNPAKMNFGVLRVLNDDTVAPGMGFGTHPHDNMEIITIPAEGALAHKDSMGNEEVIYSGDIQVMSAGTGIQHSEYNASKVAAVKLFQIWIIPNQQNVTPRYQQITLNPADSLNQLQQIVSPKQDEAGVWIHQNAWMHIANFTEDKSVNYTVKNKGNGAYVLAINGEATIDTTVLHTRDAIGIWEAEEFVIHAKAGARILVIDVPMSW